MKLYLEKGNTHIRMHTHKYINNRINESQKHHVKGLKGFKEDFRRWKFLVINL